MIDHVIVNKGRLKFKNKQELQKKLLNRIMSQILKG